LRWAGSQSHPFGLERNEAFISIDTKMSHAEVKKPFQSCPDVMHDRIIMSTNARVHV
jgi:hypothetical protein